MRLRTIVIGAAALMVAAAPAAAATGPFPARLEANPRLPNHTIYRPADLGRWTRDKLPVVVFAGGGCRNAGSRFRELLTEVASHGFFVIALGPIGNPDFDSTPDNEPDYAGRPTKTDVSQVDYAVKWARAENARAGSPYRNKLGAALPALMGQSCGGVQVIDSAVRTPDIATLVVLNSGTWPDNQSLGGSTVKQTDLVKIKVPTLILLGGKEDVAYPNGQGDYTRLVNAPAMVASANYGHRATYFQPNGGLFGTVIVDWLKWMMRGDSRAGQRFLGPKCGLCTDSEWTVASRGLESVRPKVR